MILVDTTILVYAKGRGPAVPRPVPTRHATALVSADAAFAFAPDIVHVTPDAPGIESLLAH